MVNPFIGTTYGGDTFPGPDYPFGMIQWGPDTNSQLSGGGYEYTDNKITGFSLTHLSGPGCPVMNDVGILPMTGPVSDPKHASVTFTHVQEHASPGWYDVLLRDNMDLAVSRTSTLRTGLAAFRFPGQTPAHVLFNLAHSGTNVLAAGIAFHGESPVFGLCNVRRILRNAGAVHRLFCGRIRHAVQRDRILDRQHAAAPRL